MSKVKKTRTAASPAKLLLRIAPDLVQRLDHHAKRLAVESPGMRVTRSDAIRILLNTALTAAEGRDQAT